MFLLFSIVFFNMMGFGLLFPLFPLFKMKFLLLDSEVGYISAIFAVTMMIGNIFFGILSDKYGRKLNLFIPLLCSGICYILTAFAESFTTFMILRAFTGFFSGSFCVSFAAASDLSTKEDRLKKIGLIGAATGIGFVLGPSLGGYLAGSAESVAETDFKTPFILSGIILVAIACITLIFFKESLNKEERDPTLNISNLSLAFKKILNNKTIVFYSLLNIGMTSILGGFQVFSAVWLHEKFFFSPQYIGWFWSGFGLFMGFSQAVIVPRIKNAKKSIFFNFLLYGIGFGLLAFSNSLIMVLIASCFISLSVSILTPVINTNVSLQGEKNEQGLLFGISQSIVGIGRIVGPLSLGYIYHISSSFAWLILAFLAFLLAIWSFIKLK